MSLTRKLKSAGSWQFFQIISQVVIQFGYISIMARLLTKDDFGLMAMAAAFIGFGVIFSEAGMGAALIQKKEIDHKYINAAFQGSLLLGCIVCLMMYMSSSMIAGFYNKPELEMIIKIVSFAVILNSVSSVSRSLLQKSFNFKTTANITVFVTFISYLFGVILAYFDYGVWSLVFATLMSSALMAFIMFLKAPVKIELKFYFEEFKELFYYGFGIVLLGLNNFFSNAGLSLVLGKIFTPSSLGVFERVFVIKSLPSSYLGNILDTIMFPAMSEIQNKEKRLFEVYQFSLGLVNSILMPVAVYLIFYSKEIVLILLGENWLDAIVPLQIMFVMLPLSASGRMADSVARAKGFVYKNAFRKFIYVLFLLVMSALGAKHYGLIGAAIAVTLSYLLNYILMMFLVKSIFSKKFVDIFISPLLSGVKVSV